MNLKQIAAAINANVAAYDARLIDFPAFHAEQLRLWRFVDKGEPRIVGSACARRYIAVERHLRSAA